MRKVFEMIVFTFGAAAVLQAALEFGLLATALVYAFFVYLLMGSWFVFRHLGRPKPQHLSSYIRQALSWPSLWRNP